MTKQQRWYQKNKESVKVRTKKWAEENKDRRKTKAHENYLANKEKRKAQCIVWRDANRERVREISRESSRKRNLARREEVSTRPRPEHCESCGHKCKAHWDHCHKSGKFRGWLCNRCNLALGLLKDCPSRIENLANYIRKNT